MRFLSLIYFYIRWVIRNYSKTKHKSLECLVGKTAIITGGNSGIGYATAVLLASRGCRIIIACRRDATDVIKRITEITSNTNIVAKYLDLAKLRSVRQFAKDISESESKIDILVNNAGIGVSTEMCTQDGLNNIMQVNYFGHFLLTHLLVDKLKTANSAKVVFLSSITIWWHKFVLRNINIIDSRNMDHILHSEFYINSKLCNILAAQQFGEKLKQYGITVNCVDPGLVRTPIYNGVDRVGLPEEWTLTCLLKIALLLHETDDFQAAQGVLYVATSRELHTGDHYFRCNPFSKPKILNDPELCGKIWRKSEELVKISSDERLM